MSSAIKRRLLKLVFGLPSLDLESIVPPNVVIKAPILDDICLPPYYGYDDHDDFYPLMKIIQSLQPGVVVELGTAHGNTTANICQQCSQTYVYTVNAPVEDQTGKIVTFELNQEEIGRVYRSHGFECRVNQIFKNTMDLDLSEYIEGQLVDLAIVDACHDTDFVINDFLKVQPYIRPGGIVLFHDTHPSMRDHLHGSYTACMLLNTRGYNIRHIKNTWWGIWINQDPKRKR